MKKLIAMLLALTMISVMFVGCSEETATAETTEATEAVVTKEPITATMEEVVNGIIEKNPVEFMGGCMPVDLTDTSEDGLWMISNYTGLQNAEKINEVAVYEPMMGSLAFSMVLVRVNDAAEAQAVAQEMSDNIDTRKWICVEANEKIVVGYGDVVMLIMLDNTNGMTAQSFVDAFVEIAGGELDFTI